MAKKQYLNDAGLQALWEKILKQFKNFNTFKIKVVDELPEEGESYILYLLKPANNTTTRNEYNEYVWVKEGKYYELVGSTDIDFDKYFTKEEVIDLIDIEDSSVKEWVEDQEYVNEDQTKEIINDVINNDLWEDLELD